MLLSTPTHRAEMNAMMRFHTSLLNSLAWNLQLRFSRRDDFGRGTPPRRSTAVPTLADRAPRKPAESPLIPA